MTLLSRVEVQLCMQMLDLKSLCALARCNRSLKKDAESRFALATQGTIVVASHKLAPDRANIALGLLQYHPSINITGPWNTLKRLPDAVIRAAVYLYIQSPLGIAKGLEGMLASMSRLEVLQLFHGPVKSRTVVRLFRALGERERVVGASGLRSLMFSDWRLGMEAVDALAAYVAHTTTLKELILFSCSFKKANLNILADGLVLNRSVATLDFTFSKIGLFSWQPEVALSKILRGCQSLTSLNLFSTAFGGNNQHHQLAALADAIMDGNCKLQSLNVAHNNLTSNGARTLAPMIGKLHNLEIFRNGIWEDGIRAIGDAIKTSKTIIRIDLGNNPGLVGEIESFSLNLAANKSLQVIDLDNCKIDSAMLLHLKAALVGKEELQELSLFSNNIDDSGCQHVAEIIVGCLSLELLHLGNNKIGSVGMRAIASALPQAKNLQQLDLEWNGVVDDASAAVLFAAIHDHPCLSHVLIAEDEYGFHIRELATPVLASLKPGLVQKTGW
jgi:Ran GTPase-activating protein (RanGAP) involved in mRNA processing and transport